MLHHWLHRGLDKSSGRSQSSRVLARCLDDGESRTRRVRSYDRGNVAVFICEVHPPLVFYKKTHIFHSCDLGTFPNQTTHDGSPFSTVSDELSFLPGQRLSACTCPGSDHPGPATTIGRGVPEIDILEALVEIDDTAPTSRGQVSQSYQVAPYNAMRQFNNDSSATPIQNASTTKLNHYMGDEFQQTVSALTYIDSSFYGGSAYAPYGLEWFSDSSKRESGFINWYSNGAKTWTLTSDTIGPDPTSQVSARLISEEPMVRTWVSQPFGTANSFIIVVYDLQPRHIPLLPGAGLQAHGFSGGDVHRLRARIPAPWREGWSDL